MAFTSEQRDKQTNGRAVANDADADTAFPTPDLGRSVRIVDKVVNVDMKRSPHPIKTARRTGQAAVSLASQHGFSRSVDARLGAKSLCRSAVFLSTVINQATKGIINSRKVEVSDPAVMTWHIQAVAHYMGADVVAVAKAYLAFLYAGGRYVQAGSILGIDVLAVQFTVGRLVAACLCKKTIRVD